MKRTLKGLGVGLGWPLSLSFFLWGGDLHHRYPVRFCGTCFCCSRSPVPMGSGGGERSPSPC